MAAVIVKYEYQRTENRREDERKESKREEENAEAKEEEIWDERRLN